MFRTLYIKIPLVAALTMTMFDVTRGGVFPAAATEAMLVANPALKVAVRGDHVIAIYGPPCATDNDVGTSTDDFVEAFLLHQPNIDAMGVLGAVLEFKDKIIIRNGTMAVYTYTQKMPGENLFVHDSLVKIPVYLGTTEKISNLLIHLTHHPENPLPFDALSAQQAIDVVQLSQTFGQLTTFSDAAEATKVIYERSPDELHRTWHFYGSGSYTSYEFFVDTNSGEIVSAKDIVHNFLGDNDGTVRAYWRPCCPETDPDFPACCAADTPPVLAPVPGVEVRSISGTDVCPSDDGVVEAVTMTDPNGVYSLTDVPVGSRMTSRLVGDWATVLDCGFETWTCPDRPSCASAAVQDLVAQNARLIACEDVTQSGTLDLEYNPLPDNQNVAQVTLFRYIEQAHDWFQALQPNSTAIDVNIFALANIDISNAFYSPHPAKVLGVGVAGGCGGEFCPWDCNDFGGATVVVHEYGHFIHEQLFNAVRPFTEGFADTFASLMLDTQFMSYNVIINGEGPAIRDLDYVDPILGELDAKVRCDDAFLPPNCSCPGANSSIHCWSIALSGAFWDLRKAIGDSAVERLFADFAFVTGGSWGSEDTTDIIRLVLEVLIADDDDGDLTNGTPHETEILDAFVTKHGWFGPYDAQSGTLPITWNAPGTPIAGTDYFVDIHFTPPIITFITTTGIDRWDINCTNNFNRLGTIRAAWDGLDNRDITIRIGADPNAPPCQEVDIVDVTPQSDEVWSNVDITLAGGGNIVARIQAHSAISGPNAGKGGMITGNVSGTVRRLIAGNIGSGEFTPGLFTTEELRQITLTEIGQLSELSASSFLHDELLITGTLQGDIDVSFIQFAPGSSNFMQWGRIHVKGSGTSNGNITVDGAMIGSFIKIDDNYSGIMSIATMKPFTFNDLTREAFVEVGELDGQIVINDDLDGTIRLLGTGVSDGIIQIERDILSDSRIEINGDMNGNIIVGTNGFFGEVFGTIIISGNMNGDITVGSIADQFFPPIMRGNLTIDGNMSGNITAVIIGGDVVITGDMSGDIIVDPSFPLTGTITIDGVFDGNLCAPGLSAGSPLPSDISIRTFGPNGRICGVYPCGSGFEAPTQITTGESASAMNRFLSIIPVDDLNLTAIRINELGSSDVWWVGQPSEVCENSGQNASVPVEDCGDAPGQDLTFWAAELQCNPSPDPFVTDWQDWQGTCNFLTPGGGVCISGMNSGSSCSLDSDCDTVIHIYGAAIAPNRTYQVRAARFDCAASVETLVSDPISFTQSVWGDVVKDCSPTFIGGCSPTDGSVDITTDVTAVLDKFKNSPLSPLKVRADVEPAIPDLQINIADVTFILDAFEGSVYPFAIPSCTPN